MWRTTLALLVIWAATSASYADEVTFEIRAFIPEVVDGITMRIPSTAEQNAGKSAVKVPVVNYCYLTDQRDFSTQEGAHSRVRSRATIRRSNNGRATIGFFHSCDPTILVDCTTGVEKENATCDVSRMVWRREISNANETILFVKGQAFNPLIEIFGVRLSSILGNYTPGDIDYQGRVKVDWNSGKVEFIGKVDDFPAFEATYTRDGQVNVLFQKAPKKGAAPFPSLIGDPKRDVP